MYGQVRLEGELINNAHLFFDGVNGDFTLADNSKLVNNGIVEVAICHMSSQMDSGTILGNFIIKDELFVIASIPEVF